MDKFPISIENKRARRNYLLTNLAIIALAVILVLITFFNTTYDRFYVVGSSMQHTLTGAISPNSAGGDFVYVCRYIKPKYGDIVVIDVGSRNLIKRVIAVGGERVRMEYGVLYVNDKIVEEPYVSPENNIDPEKNTFDEVFVESGYVFCMGDNRDNSDDSRGKYGCMSEDSIVGVVTGWSLQFKDAVTAWNTFFEFTLH